MVEAGACGWLQRFQGKWKRLPGQPPAVATIPTTALSTVVGNKATNSHSSHLPATRKTCADLYSRVAKSMAIGEYIPDHPSAFAGSHCDNGRTLTWFAVSIFPAEGDRRVPAALRSDDGLVAATVRWG